MRRPSGAAPVLGLDRLTVLSEGARPRVAQPTGCVASRRVTSNKTGPSSVWSLTTDTVDGSQRRTHLAVGMQLAPHQGAPPGGMPNGGLSQPTATARALFRKARNFGSQDTIFETAL